MRACRKSRGLREPSVTREDVAVPAPAQGAQHAAVIGAEGTGGLCDGLLGRLLQDGLGLDELLMQIRLVKSSPPAVVHSMAANRHPGCRKGANSCLIEKPGHSEATGDDEKRRGQSPIAECREGKLQIRSVAVVESDQDILPADGGVQQRMELFPGSPRRPARPARAGVLARRCRGA